jgi:hypothetical protein
MREILLVFVSLTVTGLALNLPASSGAIQTSSSAGDARIF